MGRVAPKSTMETPAEWPRPRELVDTMTMGTVATANPETSMTNQEGGSWSET